MEKKDIILRTAIQTQKKNLRIRKLPKKQKRFLKKRIEKQKKLLLPDLLIKTITLTSNYTLLAKH